MVTTMTGDVDGDDVHTGDADGAAVHCFPYGYNTTYRDTLAAFAATTNPGCLHDTPCLTTTYI